MMNKKQKKALAAILAGAVLFLIALFLPLSGWWRLIAFLPGYLAVGWNVVWKAVRNLSHGQVFDENFLMMVATVGAFCVGEYPEAVAVMLFYQVGELFQSVAVSRSRASISSLMEIRPDYANLEQAGKVERVDPDQVQVGQIIQVGPGERIPLDGVVLEGSSSVDTAALTGESAPRQLEKGEEALSGCVSITGLLRIQVTKAFGESTVSRVLELVEESTEKKAHTERFITRFSRYYTPIVVCLAVALAVLPPLFVGGFSQWIYRALTFLVISCPCALVISVPLGFFGGIGAGARNGVLIKGGNYLEALAKTEIVAFDKTGTLTKGRFAVTQCCPAEGFTKEQLMFFAAQAEFYSPHPIAQSLREACPRTLDPSLVAQVEELPGRGLSAQVEGRQVLAGNSRLMEEHHISFVSQALPGTAVYVAVEGRYAGSLLVADQVKEGAAHAISELKKAGIKKTVMLTGDSQAVAEQVASQLGVDQVRAQLLPGDKVSCLESLFPSLSAKGTLAFVGDGINDAPVLARADVGIAMGALGSDAAIEAADVVLMDDKPEKLALGIRLSRKALRIVWQNIIFALGVKAVVLILGAAGLSNLWEAVFADVGVSVIAILNSLRMLAFHDREEKE